MHGAGWPALRRPWEQPPSRAADFSTDRCTPGHTPSSGPSWIVEGGPMKRTLGVVSVSIVALVAVACGSPDSDPVAQSGQDLATATAASAAGGLRHAYARPDE